jgi:hypothetical protein
MSSGSDFVKIRHQPQPRPLAMTFIDGNNGNTPRFDG